MAREFNEYEQEVYGMTAEAEPIVETSEVEIPVAEVTVAEVVIPEEAPIVIAEPIVEKSTPYQSRKFIEVADEKALYETLNNKFQHEKMKPEEKALSFLAKHNPELDDKDLAFLAMTEYGIGVEPLADEELTDQQKIEIRKQDISRKKLLKQADDYFTEEASKVSLPDYDPLDLDPDYKEFRTNGEKAKDEQKQREERTQNIITELETNSKTISEITESVEIELDEGKFAVPVKFKLNEEKQNQLADFAKRYTPTQAEYDAFNDPKTGKFDYKGYMESLAPIAFAKDIAKAGMKQALAQDRQQFIEKELKNSTLRNNDVSQTTETPFNFTDYYFDNFAGK